jgi:hypothetical protein
MEKVVSEVELVIFGTIDATSSTDDGEIIQAGRSLSLRKKYEATEDSYSVLPGKCTSPGRRVEKSIQPGVV